MTKTSSPSHLAESSRRFIMDGWSQVLMSYTNTLTSIEAKSDRNSDKTVREREMMNGDGILHAGSCKKMGIPI